MHQPRLAADWAKVLRVFEADCDLGTRPDAAMAIASFLAPTNSHRKPARATNASVGDPDADFVRSCLFPEDWALVQALGC